MDPETTENGSSIIPNITDTKKLSGNTVPIEIQVNVAIPETRTPSIASVQDIWIGADWNEKETWDLVGIDFAGHEGMRRVLNPHETPQVIILYKNSTNFDIMDSRKCTMMPRDS